MRVSILRMFNLGLVLNVARWKRGSNVWKEQEMDTLESLGMARVADLFRLKKCNRHAHNFGGCSLHFEDFLQIIRNSEIISENPCFFVDFS